jgi:hypothetical protein
MAAKLMAVKKLHFLCICLFLLFTGTGARSRIISVEPESQRDAAPALTAPNLMFNICRLSKMSQTIPVTVSSYTFLILYLYQFKPKRNQEKNLPNS